ncbi:hypothetical protein OPU71_18530 [Niveibacterium sp. 24ML]|uniref:hypothetical protein n=1 Tax=Niveibacterium sp. 24ML TaxID=2985512 RepID=UPI00226D7B42|nr:hypothetical protein [Niveibacterium sp. 24ML]MCX9158123.1 hypothetical protein [Niveibacterium sp. 24ML]
MGLEIAAGFPVLMRARVAMALVEFSGDEQHQGAPGLDYVASGLATVSVSEADGSRNASQPKLRRVFNETRKTLEFIKTALSATITHPNGMMHCSGQRPEDQGLRL